MNIKSKNRQSTTHLPYLDGWRGIAIICVLIGHFGNVHQIAGIGVSVFLSFLAS